MMKPIETWWKGYRFRSRLEARWAVFFDVLGFRWEYEPEGFNTSAGPYLPDFRIRVGHVAYWYEIKPAQVSGDRKLDAFAQELRKGYKWGEPETYQYARLLSGDPVEASPGLRMCVGCGFIHEKPVEYRYWQDDRLYWYCDVCDFYGSYFSGFSDLARDFHKGYMLCPEEDVRRGLSRVWQAEHHARRARFEHGERPR